MGGKGGKPTATNDQMVQMQMQQAAQAKEANAERNARLATGTQQINEIFQGHPAGAQQLDLSAITAPGARPGNAATRAGVWMFDPQTGQPRMATASDPGSVGDTGYSWSLLPDSGSGKATYGLYSPSGLVATAATPEDLAKTKIYLGGDPNKTEGGFGQGDFYDKYRQSMLDYYLPQEGEQYTKARTGANYALARAGTLQSSTAAQDIADLAKQDVLNQAQIASQADTATGTLRNTVQQDQQSALNQLYSTEDPSVAANTAENMVANASLTKPILNPLGALFQPIVAGVGNAISGFTNPYAYITQQGPQAQTPTGSGSSGVVHQPGQ